MNYWGEITVQTEATVGGYRGVRITQADEHCLVHPNLLMAFRQEEFRWARVDGDRLVLDDGELRVTYRIGNPVYDGWNRGIQLDRVDDTPAPFTANPPQPGTARGEE